MKLSSLAFFVCIVLATFHLVLGDTATTTVYAAAGLVMIFVELTKRDM